MIKELKNYDIRAIAAVGKSGQIGLNGKLPWRDAYDLRFFNQQTNGGIVIIGYKTAEGEPFLKNLSNRIVRIWQKHMLYDENKTILEALASSPTFRYPDPVRFLLNIMQPFEHQPIKPTIWIAGGVSVYRTFAPYTRSLSLSFIDYDGDYDTVFPFDAYVNLIKIKHGSEPKDG